MWLKNNEWTEVLEMVYEALVYGAVRPYLGFQFSPKLLMDFEEAYDQI